MIKVSFFVQRTIMWDDKVNCVKLIDQNLLPEKLQFVLCRNVPSLINAIKSMKIRGAPALGVAGAMGVALSAQNNRSQNRDAFLDAVEKDTEDLGKARPTATNLRWGVDQALAYLKELPKDITISSARKRIVDFVKKLADQDVLTNKKLSKYGEKLILSGASVLTHCN